MARQYRHMSAAEQRAYDEVDLAILQCLDAGWTYDQICQRFCITAGRVARVRKECV